MVKEAEDYQHYQKTGLKFQINNARPHLIGLVCIDSLPVTGNRQGKIITNKPDRISEREICIMSLRRCLLGASSFFLLLAFWKPKLNVSSRAAPCRADSISGFASRIPEIGRCLNPDPSCNGCSPYSQPNPAPYKFLSNISFLLGEGTE